MLERINVRPEFESNSFDLLDPNATCHTINSAFDAILDQCILRAITTPLHPRAGLINTSLDIFKKDQHYSLEMLLKLVTALGIGGLTAMFNLNPAKDAINILATIARHYRRSFPNKLAWIRFAQVTTVSRSAVLSTYSAIRLIQTYLPTEKPTVAELYLRKENATCLESTAYYTRMAGSLVSAACANIPVLLFSLSLGIPLAISIMLAAIAIGWLGVNNVANIFRRFHPVHKTEIDFLRWRINEFSQFSPETKQQHIQALVDITKQGGNPTQIRKKVFLYLLKLGLSNHSDNLKVPQDTWQTQFVSYAFGALGIIPQLTFTESTIKGVANLRVFKSPTSAKAVSAATIAGLFAVVPAIGIGKGGYDAGKKLLSGAKAIGNDYHKYSRKIAEFGMILWNILAFSTIITFAYYCMKDLTNLTHIKKNVALYLQMAFMVSCFIGSTINLSYYFIIFLQMVFVFFAARNGNDHTRLEVLFESGLQQLLRHFENISDLNFLRLLKSQVIPANDAAPVDLELSEFIKNILQANLNQSEFDQMMEKITELDFVDEQDDQNQNTQEPAKPGLFARFLNKFNLFLPLTKDNAEIKAKTSLELSPV